MTKPPTPSTVTSERPRGDSSAEVRLHIDGKQRQWQQPDTTGAGRFKAFIKRARETKTAIKADGEREKLGEKN